MNELLLELIEAKRANDQGQVAFVRQALIDLGLKTRPSEYMTIKDALAEADRYNEAKTTAEQ